ncbi:uncharacterized protein LACBIDRAFT_316532 [Laccaria bicolor S238N-H82]|uniref:Predicted protein n=1 Tax=Laccaria bicolor (strain S238N-H82 / ATCC MYA-4686) TaxID=486041 RepID=B0E140_LACBS|nr:uncharacterized protein LACBIDRAFT_316532 [Laccaria bicolor S238N-H82]EDQ99447.1 predicted protein [Laccaria bicolor S238N-H82]|eukprot:XP_001889902.1 predicted protein [Laccaria bicolor S238N-H82]
MSSTSPLVRLAGNASADMMSRTFAATKGINSMLENYERLERARNDTDVAIANSESNKTSATLRDSDGPTRVPLSSPSSNLRRTFFDEVALDLPAVTHPLEYARMAYKVLYREYEEAVRARDFLLQVRSHAEVVFESPVRLGYWVPRGSNRDRDRLGFVPRPKIT